MNKEEEGASLTTFATDSVEQLLSKTDWKKEKQKKKKKKKKRKMTPLIYFLIQYSTKT